MISIIVPVYNAEAYLPDCVESVLRQNLKEIELILVNDGSTDSSGELCDIYAEQDRRVAVIHQENQGRVRARKAGLEKANYEYVMFVDADDWIDGDMCGELLHIAAEYSADLVTSGYIREGGKTVRVTDVFDEGIYDTKDRLDGLRQNALMNNGADCFGMIPGAVGKIYRRDLACEIMEPIPERLYRGEDMAFTFAYLSRSERVYVSHGTYYHYRTHDQQTVQKPVPNVFEQIGLAQDALMRVPGREDLKYGIVMRSYLNFIRIWNESQDLIHVPYYYLQLQDLNGERIVLYGAGKVGTDYYEQLRHFCPGMIVLWVDQYAYGRRGMYEIRPVADVNSVAFDKIVIAVEDGRTAEEIKKYLMEVHHVAQEKIYWQKPKCYWLN